MESFDLFIQIAAFLKMIAEGHMPASDQAKREAAELLEKVGKHLAAT